MRFPTIIIGVFLLFTSSFILRNLLSEDEVVSSEKAAVLERKQDEGVSEVIETGEALSASAVKTSPVQSTVYRDENTIEAGQSINRSFEQPSSAESEYKRMLVREQRKAMIAEKQSYTKARKEWRIALNEARAEAVVSGDYTKYNALKAEEPTKTKRSE